MKIKEIAKNYIGVKEGSRLHHSIIDYYNRNAKPLPRGYRVNYRDSWCATFVSFLLLKTSNLYANKLIECSADRMYKNGKKSKLISDVPKENYIICYSWKKNGYCNHVGIISRVTKNYIYTIEGNKNNRVETRTINRNSKYILAFIRTEKAH